jgi:hypothetical protein
MDRTRLLAAAFPRGRPPHKVFSPSVVCEAESIPRNAALPKRRGCWLRHTLLGYRSDGGREMTER